MSSTKPAVSSPLLIAASMMLVPASCYGFIRLFDDSTVVLPIIASALISTGVAVLLRMAKVPLLASFAFSFVALFVLIESRYAPGLQSFGVIPTRETSAAFRDLIDQAQLEFKEQKAPVDSVEGFVAASIIAAWLMAFLTDWGALRLRLAFEPVLPAAVLFVFASILGSGSYQQRSSVVFAVAVVVWAVTQRSVNLAARNTWHIHDSVRGPRGIALSGMAVGAIALAGGLLVGPAIPGADSEELYYWRDRGEPTRFVTSPYVNIKRRLAEQTDVVMFTVVADQPAYWRVAGLDTYDDGFWQMKGSFTEESGNLPGGGTTAANAVTIRQEFKIEALSTVWLPAAFSPSKIVESDVPATWNVDTSSLTVDNQFETSDGAAYVVESRLANYTPAELSAADPAVPADIAERYLDLPGDLTSVVQDEARRITDGALTRYDQMLLLQSHFRQFDYSLDLSPRQGDPIEQFLSERVGFCQQFSGTFALMARSLGAPARVAVGFTWGEATENENEYAVSGRHTHAWPEVWFADLGWVAFEPTPGRGAPNAQHTEQTQSQDSPEAPENSTPATTLPVPDPLIEDGLDEFDLPDADQLNQLPDSDFDQSRAVPWKLLGALGLTALYVVGVPALRAAYRRRQDARAVSSRAKIDRSWSRGAHALRLGFALEKHDWESYSEFAHRAINQAGAPADSVIALSEAATIARYSPSDSLQKEVDAASAASETIVQQMHQIVPLWKRWIHEIDPRNLRSA